jgi:hypothetical protein
VAGGTRVRKLPVRAGDHGDLGDRLGEGDDLRLLSHLLWPLGRTGEATAAGRASLRLLENLEPCPQLAWSLVNQAELATFSYDPDAARYAARAITLGAQLGEPAVVIRARYYAAMASVLRTDTGWQELEAAWRDAMATEALAEHAGLMGAMLCWAAALHVDVDRGGRYIAETSTFCGDRDLGMFQALAVAADALLALERGDWAHAVACADDVLTRAGLKSYRLHREHIQRCRVQNHVFARTRCAQPAVRAPRTVSYRAASFSAAKRILAFGERLDAPVSGRTGRNRNDSLSVL